MFTDADFATNRDDRISMGGYIFYIDNVAIEWKTFKQKCVSLSTMEAEYVSMTEAARELVWFKNILTDKELNLIIDSCVLHCDNQAAIHFSKSSIENAKTKHIDVRLHYIRDLIKNKVFEVNYVKSQKNPADIFTKPQVKDHIRRFCSEIFEGVHVH